MADCGNPEDFLVVSAIDFGTTYSGYAFALRDTPNDIYSPSTWYAGGSTLASLKTPTCILLKEDKSFDCFGYEAQNKYASLAEDGKHGDYYFFEQFKMILHQNRTLSRGTMIEAIDGKILPAIRIFSLSIGFFKEHILKTLTDRIPNICLEDIRFVLTVPAIWDDKAKQFMREAAVNAGIDGDRLMLAFEPEAASIYCAGLPVEKLQGGEGFTEAPNGTRYLIADIGGGTADFCVHEKISKEEVKEVYKASGGAFGGMYVNKEYKEFLKKIFGRQSLQKLQLRDMGDFLDIERSFEVKKRDAKSEIHGNVTIRIPFNLVEISKAEFPNLAEHTAEVFGTDEVSVMWDKIKINSEIFQTFFRKSIDGITDYMNEIIKEIPNISMILLVGGFAESSILQTSIKNRFMEQNLIIPEQPGLSVVKGAVMYGYNPTKIFSRILRYTYGTSHNLAFDPNKHPTDRKYMYINEDGKERCRGTFDMLVSKGASLKSTGKVISKQSAPFNRSTNTSETRIYYSEEKDPYFIEQCTLLGKVRLRVPPYTGKRRVVQKSFTFGRTEIAVVCTFLETGESIKASFDLLE
ncbi:heat shock 70 kDa protein 12A-like [Saccostrea echinata]|uniref:heat shock 70 kDa protein 12A-like n=1 Tax=Saccostrea echinata TaxID=191078 RepID=UPI002A825B7E|nr:heat shock 70 kDa protein 12A-like [Saccostrea echinata]